MEKENKIIELLDALIPRLEQLLSDMRFWAGFAMLIGPILFLGMGALDYFAAPAEANHRVGYRTYFGMGSVKAWKYTQKLAGMVWGGLGAVLALVAIIVCICQSGKEPAAAMSAALILLIVEAVCALLAFLAVEIIVAVRYDMNGNVRKK